MATKLKVFSTFTSSKEARIDGLASILLFILITLFSIISGFTLTQESYNNILSVYTTVGATMLGFMFTAFSILITFPKEGVIRNIRYHKNYSLFYKYFVGALIILLLCLVISATGLLIPEKWMLAYFYLTLFVIIYSFISIFRVIRLLGMLVDFAISNNT